jgi:hypothetical protein
MTMTRPTTNPWRALLFAGLFTGVIAWATGLLFQADMLVLYILGFLLIGAGPVLGYQLATGRLGSDWKAIVGGILGFILLILGWLLWPLLVGAMSRNQSIGSLYLGSITGFFVGVALFLLSVTILGQNPSSIMVSFILLWIGWGATCGYTMAALELPEA